MSGKKRNPSPGVRNRSAPSKKPKLSEDPAVVDLNSIDDGVNQELVIHIS